MIDESTLGQLSVPRNICEMMALKIGYEIFHKLSTMYQLDHVHRIAFDLAQRDFA